LRKLLSGGIVVFAGMVAAPFTVSPQQASKAPAPDYRKDPRLERLRRFFMRQGCPAQQFSQAFLEAADRNALDWRLLPSISFVESSGGKAFRNNNLFGWASGRAAFPSVTAGIHTVGYHLANSALYKDKSLDGVLATYNPGAEYAKTVKSVMRRISPTE
jgi:hypothetical protein